MSTGKDKSPSDNVVPLKALSLRENSSPQPSAEIRGIYVETLPHWEIKFIPLPQTASD